MYISVYLKIGEASSFSKSHDLDITVDVQNYPSRLLTVAHALLCVNMYSGSCLFDTKNSYLIALNHIQYYQHTYKYKRYTCLDIPYDRLFFAFNIP